VKQWVRSFLAKQGIEVRKLRTPEALLFEHLAALQSLPQPLAGDPALARFFDRILQQGTEAKAQLYQDLLAVELFNEKENGFFVEFGATNGLQINNTWLLEKKYHWQGILAEPARIWQADLAKNRNCAIDHRCVWKQSGEKLIFKEVPEDPELSTAAAFVNSDHQAAQRKQHQAYEVTTISLYDLLQAHHAPRYIDYLSVDTEGSEFEILNAFDFSTYRFGLITVEHNGTTQQQALYELLTRAGYKRVFAAISKWDDWYVAPEWLKS
jgi:FkbM family methyltransferase